MSDLVKAPRSLPELAEVERHLTLLKEAGDVDQLVEASRQAEAYEAYERRAGAKERADHFGRIKVLAEATVGAIDIAEFPSQPQGEWRIRDVVLPHGSRNRWRLLAIAHENGRLAPAMDTLAKHPDRSITTSSTYRELRDRGEGFYDPAPLAVRFEELKKSEGLTGAELERRLPDQMANSAVILMGSNGKKRKTVKWRTAVALADALGVDRTEIKPMVVSRRGKARGGKKLGRKLRPGRWDKAYTHIRQALEEIDELRGTKDDRVWALLYEAGDIVRRRA